MFTNISLKCKLGGDGVSTWSKLDILYGCYPVLSSNYKRVGEKQRDNIPDEYIRESKDRVEHFSSRKPALKRGTKSIPFNEREGVGEEQWHLYLSLSCTLSLSLKIKTWCHSVMLDFWLRTVPHCLWLSFFLSPLSHYHFITGHPL